MAPNIKNLPVSTTRSKVEEFRKQFFYRKKTENEESKLHGQSATDVLLEIENERSKVQLEINKLVFAIEDPLVPMTNLEISETNDEINRKLQMKYSIENDIFKMTRGARDYIPTELKGNLSQYKYFGRAKDLQKRAADEAERSREGGAAVASGLVKLGVKKEVLNFQHDAVVEEALQLRDAKKITKRKRNIFDDDDSAESVR